jgi:hypothetical protein
MVFLVSFTWQVRAHWVQRCYGPYYAWIPQSPLIEGWQEAPDRAGMTSKLVGISTTFCSKEPGSFIGQEIERNGKTVRSKANDVQWHWSSTTKGSVPHSSRWLTQTPDDTRSLKNLVRPVNIPWIIMHGLRPNTQLSLKKLDTFRSGWQTPMWQP